MLSTSFAYVEFSEPEHIDAALALDNSLFHGRLIKASVIMVYCVLPVSDEMTR